MINDESFGEMRWEESQQEQVSTGQPVSQVQSASPSDQEKPFFVKRVSKKQLPKIIFQQLN